MDDSISHLPPPPSPGDTRDDGRQQRRLRWGVNGGAPGPQAQGISCVATACMPREPWEGKGIKHLDLTLFGKADP
jgi:hypothetical protein